MYNSVQSILRRLAYVLQEDDTPTEEDKNVRTDIHQKTIPIRETGRKVPAMKKTKSGEIVELGTTKKVAPPKIKPPRRLHETEKEWNEETSPEKMREYMRQYRSTGKDKETGNPKSTNIRKIN